MKDTTKEAIVIFIIIILVALVLFFMPGCAFAQEPITVNKDDCQNPETLSPEMKKAYEELKELLKDENGIDVKIQCKEVSHARK